MKIIFTLTLSLLTFFCKSQGYKIVLQTPSYTSGIAYLTYHMGKNLNVQDSAALSNKGLAVFEGKTPLVPGIYAVVLPGKNFSADFLIDKEQQIKIVADTLRLADMQVTGSPADDIFKDYKKYVAVKGAQLQKEKTAYMQARTKADSVLHEDNYTAHNKELNQYRESIISNQPNSMMAALLTAMKEPPLPSKVPVTNQDSIDNYNFYRAHYWDGITFMDERILRTPFFLPKMERYYREVMPQSADSIIKDVDYKLLLARTAPELYKFLLNWLTDEYINPKYMGQDAIFVHLFEKYHSKGLSGWLNEKQMETITRRAYMQMSNLIGEKAANLEMLTPAGKPASLFDVDAPYTVVVFWDPTCGHCKEELPKIDSIYRASWKDNKVKIYAVLTEDHLPEWNQYIADHNIQSWTHVYQTKEMQAAEQKAQRAGFRQLYDITQTPILYLLDKDKRIIGKKLTWLQLNDLLQVKTKSDKNKSSAIK